MTTVLDSIIAGVRDDLAERVRARSLADVTRDADAAPPARDALAAFHAAREARRIAVISEVKRSSPSKGALAQIPDPAALAAAMARLLSDPALVDQLGLAGRQHAERLSWDAAADAVERDLQDLVAGVPLPPSHVRP